MRKQSHLSRRWTNVVFWLITVLVVALDQLTKVWIRSNLPIGQSICEKGFFRIIHVENSGAAFGLFPGQALPLILASLVAAVILLVYVHLLSPRFPLLDNVRGKGVLGLISGGLIGNLIDRLRFGHVTDFIDLGWWPAFNVADSAATIGVVILVLIFLLSVRTTGSAR